MSYGLGIDIDHFRNRNGNQIRMKYASAPEQKIVLFVGRLCKQKNIPLLLNAASQIVKIYPMVIFLVLGEGSEQKSLMHLALKLGLAKHIHFIGSVPYANIPDFYAASDIVVLPSFYEGWPRVVMETIVSGKPVVTTDGEFLKHDPFVKDYCHIVPTYDAARWAQVIVEVLQKGPESGEGEKSFKEAQYKFTQDLAIERFIDAWNKTIKPLHDLT